MFFSEMVDRVALQQLHKKRSSKFQYVSPPKMIPKISERETFYQGSPITLSFQLEQKENGYQEGTFEGKSAVSSATSSNDTIQGEAFISHENAPNVIFVHGWRSESHDRVKKIFHEPIMGEFNWNMYYYVMPYHLEREPNSSLYSGEHMISANIPRTLDAVQQAIIELRALIQWLRATSEGPIIIVGVSLGGFLTNLLATLEKEIDILVSIFYANRLSYAIFQTIAGKYIKDDLEHHGVTYKDLQHYWRILDPSHAKPQVSKDNILLISAKHDQYVHMEDADHLWEQWDKPTRYIYHCGHAGFVFKKRKLAQDTITFIQRRIVR